VCLPPTDATSISIPPHRTGADLPQRIAVVRDAFAAHDAAPRALADTLHVLGARSVAVAAAVSHPHARLVVDEYEAAPGGTYVLRSVGGDLHRFLRAGGLRVAHVPDVPAAAARATNSARAAASARHARQSTNEVLMVAPTAFVFNAQAAADNTFMHSAAGGGSDEESQQVEPVTRRVLREFAALHHELSEVAGVRVNLFQHSLQHGTPDAGEDVRVWWWWWWFCVCVRGGGGGGGLVWFGVPLGVALRASELVGTR
jgi:hypothetical protein